MENIDIDKDNLKNIDIDIDMAILENIDIDKGILQNIDIDKISYRLGFGISNTPTAQTILIGKFILARHGRVYTRGVLGEQQGPIFTADANPAVSLRLPYLIPTLPCCHS